jgi:progressive ankylosis protein
VAMAVVAFPPVFNWLAWAMGLPAGIAKLTHTATTIVLLWPAAIGYRRFYQGLLVRAGLTRRVAYGTVIRLGTMSMTAAVLAWRSSLPGATIGAASLIVGVISEAAASRWMSWHIVKELEATPPPAGQTPLTVTGIIRFYYPLAMASVLSLITGPVVTFFMGHSRNPIESLAVLPVINSFVFLFRSGAFAYQEVAVALTGIHREHKAEIVRVSRILGGAATIGLALVAWTPLLRVWFEDVSGLTPEMASFAIIPMRILVLHPALEYLLFLQRSLLILARRTRFITVGTAIEATGISVGLALSVGPIGLVGVTAAAVAAMVGRLAANTFLEWAVRTEVRQAGGAA